MEPWGIAVLVVFLFLAVYFTFALILMFKIHQKIFGVRGKDPDNPCYLQWEDFPTLKHEPFAMRKAGENRYGKPMDVTIRGYYYQDDSNRGDKGFILLSHGMFGTHLQYLCDIAYLTKAGYEVLAFDQYGVGESDGENQVSLSQGIYTLDLVIGEVEKEGVLRGRDLILYGHSWGAYCSLGALKKHPEVKKAVLRSGPVDPIKAGLHLLKMKSKPLYYVMLPWARITSLLLFGKHNAVNAAKWGDENNTTKILALAAEDDPMVDKKNSIVTYYTKHPKANVVTFLTEKGLHNSIITEESYHTFVNKAKEYYSIVEGKEDEQEKARRKEKFIASLDRASYLVYQDSVKEKILSFLQEE